MYTNILRRARLHWGLCRKIPAFAPNQVRFRGMAQFFAPNEHTDPETPNPSTEKACVSPGNYSRPFLDPNAFYPQVEITDPAIIQTVLDLTYEPAPLWLDLCHANDTNAAHTGSFIEFIHNDEICFGVVLREPYAKFNQYHNRMIVLTIHNELVKVYPQDITFLLHKVLESDAVLLHHILANRFNELYPARARLVQVLHQFMASVASHRDRVSHALTNAHANIAAEDHASPVCLPDIVQFIEAQAVGELPSLFHQCALLMSVYTEMCRDASRWMVPGCLVSERVTNLSFGHVSNTLPPSAPVFAAPTSVFAALLAFTRFSDENLREFDDFLVKLQNHPVKYDDLILQFEIWDAKRFRPALKAMMYALVYPHPQIMQRLLKMTVLGPHPSRDSVSVLLKEIGLYDNEENALTDPILSAGILGKVKRNSLIASSARDLETTSVEHSAAVESLKNAYLDNFLHLRAARLFFHDTTAYVLPGALPNLAISMEEINSRRFLINIHVADLASRLSPSSAAYAKWSANATFLEHKAHFLGVDKSPLLPTSAMRNVLFTKSRAKAPKDYFTVGDYADEHATDGGETQTCMTLTFEYNSYLEDPMKNLENSVRVSFDALRDFQFKPMDADVLEKSLTGKLEPSILGKLRLFTHHDQTSPKDEKPVDATDHYNLNFIYNVMRRHFEARNRKYAVSLGEKARPRDVHKSLSSSPDSDVIKTSVRLADESELYEKSTFLRSEVETLAGSLAAKYASKNRIPVFYQNKPLLNLGEPDTNIRDEVLIRHDNLLLPDFSAASYFQVAYGRDVLGHLSTPAHLFASNFLGKAYVSTADMLNAASGTQGTVNVVDVTESLSAYLNQLQLLQHVHFTQTATNRLFKDAHRFSHLRGLGYNLHGSLKKDTLEKYTGKFNSSLEGSSYLAARQRKYWVLKSVEQNPIRYSEMRCIVTHISRDIDMSLSASERGILEADFNDSSLQEIEEDTLNPTMQSVRAYCEELGIEVDLLVGDDRGVLVGSEVIATGVSHVSAALGTIVLM